ncbi:hypothetical protein F5Y14DRAFT_29204 [Nemania sp. NC0429]|nr:hypothetical protein F5Y14DRAFT_29204 [Nemania sp. NC0429]
MHLFHRRHGIKTAASLARRDEDKVTEKVNKNEEANPPPSYEDSQDASLRAVLDGAETIAPLLWPSAHAPLSPSADDYWDMSSPDINSALGKNDRKAENQNPDAEETTVADILASLAATPCGERPLLSRIREFSDFYFAPYVLGDETPAARWWRGAEPGSGSSSSSGPTSTFTSTPNSPSSREQQRKALETVPASRESAALVLCARVLETYYASLGHATADLEGNVTRKTRLTQLAACAEPGCACGDYDEATITTYTTTTTAPHLPSPPSETQNRKDCADTGNSVDAKTRANHIHVPPPRHCACGHARASHPSTSASTSTSTSSAASAGVARLVRRYTNWRGESYASLGHRSPSGVAKRHVGEIMVCGAGCAPLSPCPSPCRCRDYDKGRRTGRCARCGHYDHAHVSIHDHDHDHDHAAHGQKRDAEWELSWILIENAYLLLGEIATSLNGGKATVNSSSS